LVSKVGHMCYPKTTSDPLASHLGHA
jgi:hypothetical protein